MTMPDYAKAVKDAVAADWVVLHPTWTVTLDVGDDYAPIPNEPALLVADDTGPALIRGAWVAPIGPRVPTLRLTGFAAGRTEALTVVNTGAEFVRINKPGIARIEDISVPLITRDRETGAFLASITMPVIVRQLTTP
jgi:hypothetical protein